MQPARPIYRVKEVVESISEVYIALATLSGTVVAPTQPYFLPLRARAAAAVLSFTRFFFPLPGRKDLALRVLPLLATRPRIHEYIHMLVPNFFQRRSLVFVLNSDR